MLKLNMCDVSLLKIVVSYVEIVNHPCSRYEATEDRGLAILIYLIDNGSYEL